MSGVRTPLLRTSFGVALHEIIISCLNILWPSISWRAKGCSNNTNNRLACQINTTFCAFPIHLYEFLWSTDQTTLFCRPDLAYRPPVEIFCSISSFFRSHYILNKFCYIYVWFLPKQEVALTSGTKFDRLKMEDTLKRRFFYDQSFALYGGE